MNKYYYPEERVAVVAMSCLMPDAVNPDMLWENILSKKVSIRNLPDRIFDKSVYYQPEVYGKINKEDKTYTQIGAVIDELDFTDLGRKYRIPPAVSAYMDDNQKAAIYCVDQVMGQVKSSLPKDRTAVILNSVSPGVKFENAVRRTFFSKVEKYIRNHPTAENGKSQIDPILDEVSKDLLKDTQPITEDTATGYLQNITAGRIANIFDFQGPAYIVDSACASSLTAISIAAQGLINHAYDAVITGGVEVCLADVGYIAFSGINALSPDGSYPFDARANGFVMGQGGAVVVLKRLSDALRDGDTIYSVISGYGMGSDGRGKFIAAPSEEGQVRVIQSACKMAGYDADTIEMIEAHGTGTMVGDTVEAAALRKAFLELGANKQKNCGIGSIKSNIGHLRNAAGAAGFIKASLALYNKTLPASANIKEVNPKLQIEGSPFYILCDNRKWAENPLHPRRANVSAYGFGGANCHICLEEFRPEFTRKTYQIRDTRKVKKHGKVEAIFFSGDSPAALVKAYETFVNENAAASDDCILFEKAVYQNNVSASGDNVWRISICACSMEQLKEKWQLVYAYIREDKLEDANGLQLKGIFVGNGENTASSKIALMFPGQGSQYPNMLRELYETYPVVRSFYRKADALWKAKYNNSVMPLLFEEEQDEILKNTKNTHPAMFLSNMGVYQLLCEAGIKADYMIGHSLGEITALYAGGMADLKSAVKIIGERGHSFDSIEETKRGSMVSVPLHAETVKEMITSNEFEVRIANVNSPTQTVVGGEDSEIRKFINYLSKKGCAYTPLQVSHAFHTSLVSKAAEAFYEGIEDIRFHCPACKVMACHLTDFYPDTIEASKEMAKILQDQIVSQVRFKDSIRKLYEEGVRIFIESGPSDVLTKLVRNILSDEDVRVVNINSKKISAVQGFQQAIAALFAYGVDVTGVPGNTILGLRDEEAMYREAELPEKEPAKEIADNCEKPIGNPVFRQMDLTEEKAGRDWKKESIVYSGVSIGLPGSFKKAFSDDNFNYLTEGRNFIEMLTDEEAQSIMDLNVTRLIKTEKEAVFKKISSINEVIHFAGKFGKMDMVNDYHIDEKVLKRMTQAVCAGVAAGYEALKDAGIPLVKEFRKTSSGTLLPQRWVLPKEMQEDTGIIYASGLYPIEAVISEVSKYTAAKFGSGTRKELMQFFEAVISKVSDFESKKILTDWFTMHYARLAESPSEGDIYAFNHEFLETLTTQANNRLSQLIGATGPNMFLCAACSSTASAVTVAEDLIRAGHARRMIVIGADITSGKNLLPWFGAAFSSIGSLTESDSLFDAAVPFDNRRKGMILSSGAVGLIIEKEMDVAGRGMNGICRILGTHLFNSAGHQSRVDVDKHCKELDKFVSRMEEEHHFSRNAMTSKLVYYSHETYSHKQGGCSSMEKHALEKTFGEKFREIKVINTKGMTGHTLGASIEEAAAAKALQYQKLPPIVNYKEPDPDLEGLNLSRGGEYAFEYVLRTVAAFGGNGNYQLLQRVARGEDRIIDGKAYRDWIEGISSKTSKITAYGRILVAEDNNTNDNSRNKEGMDGIKIDSNRVKTTQPDVIPAEVNSERIAEEVLEVFADITKYPIEMLDLSMEAEADLGIDTVKQATIFSILADRFHLELFDGESLSNYPTIGDMVQLVLKKTGKEDIRKDDFKEDFKNEGKHPVSNIKSNQDKSISDEVLELISKITKYPVEMLEEDMELEADLGIDTIKQATIVSELSERFADTKGIRELAELKTIKSILDAVESSVKKNVASEKPQRIPDSNETSALQEEMVGADSNTDKDVAEEDAADAFDIGLCMQCPVIVRVDPGTKNYDLVDKNIIIIGDTSEITRNAAEYFKNISSNICEIAFEDYRKAEELEQRMDCFQDNMITADVILDCSHLGQAYALANLTREEEEEILYLNSTARFLFYKKLAQVRPNPEIRILCTVSMDGCFGFGDGKHVIIDPYYGALCGFYKGLRKEFKKSKIKLVDLGTSEGFTISHVAFEWLTEELEDGFETCEIGYVNKERVTLGLEHLDRSELTHRDNFISGHFVITGGGNGITAEIVREIITRGKAKYTILGRTEIPFNIEELVNLDQASLEQKRTQIYERYQKEGKKATPAQVEREYGKLLNAISIYRLLNEIRDYGSDALYFPCDVTDYQGVKSALLKATLAFGPVNVLIHGAGIEKSRCIEQKTKEEFAEVFDVKAKGLCNLYRLTENKELKTIIGFSSISGRFGNGAQLDYCTANSFISSFMSMIKSCHKGVRAVSIAWSGWKDLGMAWRNAYVRENAEEIGLNLIEPDRGAREFANILMSNIDRDEIIISKGIGFIAGVDQPHGLKTAIPFIDWITKKDGDIEAIHRVVSVKKDPIIKHHRLGKIPLMPAVAFMEMGAQAHSIMFGKKEQYCFQDVKLENPLKLFHENPQEIVMKPKRSISRDSMEAVFYHYFKPRIGKDKLIELNRMKVYGNLGEYEYLHELKKVENDLMVEMKYRDSLMSTMQRLHNAINLGPLFMDEKAAEINKFQYDQEGVILSVALSEEQITNKKYNLDNLLINPAFADTLMQACGLHSSINADGIYLPWEIGEFGIVKAARVPGLFRAYAKMKSSNGGEKSYDVILYSAAGEVCYYAKNVIVKRIAQ